YDNNIYTWTNGNFDPYLVMTNVNQMQLEVTSRGGTRVNPYEAVGRFIIAYYYYNLTSLYGDVPEAQALEAPKNSNPAYTPQEQVFKYVLDQLDSANTDMAALIAQNDNSLSTTQDIYYHGDLTLWQKAVNSFKLRVLVALSPKASDATLNVPAQFSAILGNSSKYPVFTSQGDDLEFVYNPGGGNTYSTYPFNPSNFGSIAARFNMAKTYVDAVVGLDDPRVFITCEPAWTLVGSDPNPAQYKYFAGASTGESVASMYNNANTGIYSFINRKRYYSNFTGEPDVLLGYKELCFNIAEGITRGWASGNAETWYKKGITESMAFYGIDVSKTGFDAYFLPPGANSVTQVAPYPFTFNFTTWYAQPSVTLSSTAATAINQIVLQKYIASFENSGYESYCNWRRTGTPTFLGGSGVGNNGVVPIRWAYPVSEQAVNASNWNAAVKNQGWNADDLNQKMWLLK
ncbi:MAG TPA: SusD/RagB family nutrient-binding outer membrane lipoprotein, partial [Puia sp.]|nr:SusD/RagB family nutrient-binding outer membrane lipoprotein [Puia sp.]